ncbi:MAG: hypothetical protein NUV47_03455 [Patescibacteria group bacterium]|nr:hypothetical protein [Patescibacteria group bacterium]
MEDSINSFLGSHRLLVILVGGFIIIGPFVIPSIKDYFSSDSKLRRKKSREKRNYELKQQIQEKLMLTKETENRRKIERQKIQEQRQRIKDGEHQKYLDLRKQIEKMPIYQRWKQEIMNKCGSKCQMCGSSNNLQVHHLDSFYSIIKQYNITSIEKAFECKQLWNVDNGEILCKNCHDKMESSINRQTLMYNT